MSRQARPSGGADALNYRDLITKMAIDAEFAADVLADPDGVGERYGLSESELAALRALGPASAGAAPSRLGVRLSKSGVFFGGDALPDGADYLETSLPDPLATVLPDHAFSAIAAEFTEPGKVVESDPAAQYLPDEYSDPIPGPAEPQVIPSETTVAIANSMSGPVDGHGGFGSFDTAHDQGGVVPSVPPAGPPPVELPPEPPTPPLPPAAEDPPPPEAATRTTTEPATEPRTEVGTDRTTHYGADGSRRVIYLDGSEEHFDAADQRAYYAGTDIDLPWVRDGNGQRYEASYGADGTIITWTDGGGRHTASPIGDSGGWRETITATDGATTTIVYDAPFLGPLRVEITEIYRVTANGDQAPETATWLDVSGTHSWTRNQDGSATCTTEAPDGTTRHVVLNAAGRATYESVTDSRGSTLGIVHEHPGQPRTVIGTLHEVDQSGQPTRSSFWSPDGSFRLEYADGREERFDPAGERSYYAGPHPDWSVPWPVEARDGRFEVFYKPDGLHGLNWTDGDGNLHSAWPTGQGSTWREDVIEPDLTRTQYTHQDTHDGPWRTVTLEVLRLEADGSQIAGVDTWSDSSGAHTWTGNQDGTWTYTTRGEDGTERVLVLDSGYHAIRETVTDPSGRRSEIVHDPQTGTISYVGTDPAAGSA